MRSTSGGNYVCDKCCLAVNDLVYRPQTGSIEDILKVKSIPCND